MLKRITRRSTLALGASALAAPLASVRADQTGLPDKPIKILVGFPAGGGTDVMARFIADALKQRTGRNVIIDNKAGASGTIAVETLKNSPPDGTVIAYVPSATIVQKLTMESVPFDPLTDLLPITLAGTVQTAFCVSPTIGVNSLPEYIEWLKKNPTRQSFGTTALGSFTHFFGVMAGREIGIPLEPVPYRGAAPLVADLQGGHIAAGCGGITDFLEHHRAGKVKVIFTSGLKPTTSALEIPTATQLGYPKLNILGWYVFFAPAKLPAGLNEAWGRELQAVLRSPEVTRKLVELGLDIETSTPTEFTQRMTADLARWKTIIDSIGYKPGN
ncbi:tripartite tricarboxylate transporter substrate-binding protein [Reyranella sp.]|uniref:tripartite tricarboxylate transporter substrate-binding protein n=1 Tax=Reyranella sp. TaxID=1929291 RepID=UPI0037834E24